MRGGGGLKICKIYINLKENYAMSNEKPLSNYNKSVGTLQNSDRIFSKDGKKLHIK
jgi:hypothetical protein